MRFYNPYHFVPVKAETGRGTLSVEDFKADQLGHVTHDRYLTRTAPDGSPVYSGRLLCRLTTEDPVVVGAKRQEGEPHEVFPFELPMERKPALPASTLRGLVGAMAETASNSALRILEDRSLSYRVSMQNALSAIGMIIEAKDDQGNLTLRLRPLALPTMPGPLSGDIELEERYRQMFPLDRTPPFKLYVGDYDEIRHETFIAGLPLRSFSRDNPEYCYAKLHLRAWNADHSLAPDTFQHRRPGGSQDFLLSQKTVDGQPPRLPTKLPEDTSERVLYSRGILRVLGVPGRDEAIPRTKKHELFIPYPEDIEAQPTFPILPDAITRFYQLADERTDASKEAPFLPYEPRGTVRHRTPDGSDDQRFRLKDGDLVYFQPDATGTAVTELSLSAIWRREAGGSSYTYFKQLSPELLPFHAERQSISLAEQVFGFVEQRQDRDDGEHDSAALASRLRFSFGHLHPDLGAPYYEDRVLLKILDTPKPPAPAFYFKTRHGRGSYIAKHELNPESHVPQGRKFYLHRPPRLTRPWRTSEETENLRQKSYVTPIKSELSFYFHIDFDNLSAAELGLLCYAIRPSEAFRHKLGMGKSIGLGKVRLDPVGLFYVDRQARYQETSILEANRYQQIWMAAGENPDDWPDIYARERKDVANQPATGASFDTLREGFAHTIHPDIQQALRLLGDPQMLPASARVHTPQVESASQPWEMEQETYQWFVENERAGHQFLKPLNAETTELPSLER